MATSLHALIYPSAPTVIVERRMLDLANVPAHKQAWWRPVVQVGDDAFDPLTHKKAGPVTTIQADQVTDTYTIVALTAQEISDAKDAALGNVNGNYKVLRKALLAQENDNRAIKAKVNDIIDALAISAAVPKFPNAQAQQITMVQLISGLKALL